MKKPLKIFWVVLIGLGLSILWGKPLSARDGGDHQRITAHESGFQSTTADSLLLHPVYFFKRYLSAADGDRCPMVPSCSTYCVEALQKHGLLIGWVMTCDRLMRCGRDELKRSPAVWIDGGRRCYDPVHRNDFWWHP